MFSASLARFPNLHVLTEAVNLNHKKFKWSNLTQKLTADFCSFLIEKGSKEDNIIVFGATVAPNTIYWDPAICKMNGSTECSKLSNHDHEVSGQNKNFTYVSFDLIRSNSLKHQGGMDLPVCKISGRLNHLNPLIHDI